MAGDGDPLTHASVSLKHRHMSDRYRSYAFTLLKLVSENLDSIDGILSRSMPNWRLERLAAVDRNILRIGSAELLYVAEVPGKVAIHEAIRLSEKYASAESPAFINGVLDAIYRETRDAVSSSETRRLDSPG